MKRRTLLLGGGALLASGAALMALRPDNHGKPYDAYFKTLNETLRLHGPGRPVLVVDVNRLKENIARVRKSLPQGRDFRIVAKSLPSPALLQQVMTGMNTNRLMVFHQPDINTLATRFPDSDLLLGKPMPVNAVSTFYRFHADTRFDPSSQLTWLIDSTERLAQYAQLARTLGTRMQVSLEIDVGLHRGGLKDVADLAPVLELVRKEHQHITLKGLMGYDAHVGKLPAVIATRAEALAKANQTYHAFRQGLYAMAPEYRDKPLVMNGAGSPTFRLHDKSSPLTEVSAGSCFVKPSDFDLDLLADLQPATWIATPVLKSLVDTTLPGLDDASHAWSLWDPNRERSFFIYGGLWMAHPVAPEGLVDNPLYGKSSNQAILNGSSRIALRPDDHVFLRPTQSERVLQELGDILALEGQNLSWWPVFAA